MNTHLAIVYEDADCLAVAKPAGQFTQGTWAPPGQTTLEQDVRCHLNPHDPSGVYLGIVHRLDRPTSGVLLWAKTAKAARRLSAQFEGRRAAKEYWALVTVPGSGESASTQGDATWSDWLTRTARTGLARIVAPGTPGARPAETRVRFEPTSELHVGTAWLKLWPATGRTHQLRAQASARGMPILGDWEYGSATLFGAPHIIALHARSLRVQHPILQTSMELIAPIPPIWGSFGVSTDDAGPAPAGLLTPG